MVLFQIRLFHLPSLSDMLTSCFLRVVVDSQMHKISLS